MKVFKKMEITTEEEKENAYEELAVLEHVLCTQWLGGPKLKEKFWNNEILKEDNPILTKIKKLLFMGNKPTLIGGIFELFDMLELGFFVDGNISLSYNHHSIDYIVDTIVKKTLSNIKKVYLENPETNDTSFCVTFRNKYHRKNFLKGIKCLKLFKEIKKILNEHLNRQLASWDDPGWDLPGWNFGYYLGD